MHRVVTININFIVDKNPTQNNLLFSSPSKKAKDIHSVYTIKWQSLLVEWDSLPKETKGHTKPNETQIQHPVKSYQKFSIACSLQSPKNN